MSGSHTSNSCPRPQEPTLTRERSLHPKPPKGAVRLEELVNYFSYDYNEPKGESPFSVTTEIAKCPWASDHQLMRVALRGRSIDLASRKPCNIVFLLDVSGSMQSPDKLPLVKSALKMLVGELNGDDRIAMVVYAGSSGLVLDSTPIHHSQKILTALGRLEAGGSTNGVGCRFQSFRISDLDVVSQTFASWNRMDRFVRQIEALRRAASH